MKKILGNILMAIGFVSLFALCLAYAAIRVLDMQTLIVTGGSMEPNIRMGALVLVQPASPSEVKLGDVITFQQYGQTTSHRVIAIGQQAGAVSFKTKGDANTVADPEDKTFAAQVGIVRVSIPLAGYVAFGVQAYWRIALTLVAAICFFGCAGGLVFQKRSVVPARGLIARTAPVVAAPLRAKLVWAVDADETWRAHVEWLRRSHRNTMVA